jgi:hypothetical protein
MQRASGSMQRAPVVREGGSHDAARMLFSPPCRPCVPKLTQSNFRAESNTDANPTACRALTRTLHAMRSCRLLADHVVPAACLVACRAASLAAQRSQRMQSAVPAAYSAQRC